MSNNSVILPRHKFRSGLTSFMVMIFYKLSRYARGDLGPDGPTNFRGGGSKDVNTITLKSLQNALPYIVCVFKIPLLLPKDDSTGL